jgi:PDZ domain-containing secreted protein
MDSVAAIETKIKTDLSWLQKHERLVLAVIAGLVLWFGIGKIDTLLINHDHSNLEQAKVVAQVQQEKNDALAKQIAQDKADYTALAAQVQARDAQLVQLQATLVTALAQRQKTDATLPPTELVQRLNTLVPNASSTVTPTGVALPLAGAVVVVQQLETVPVLTSELSITNEKLANADKLIAAEGTQVDSLTALVGGLQAKSVDDAKVCSAQVAVVKAEARKGKRKWFIVGVVVGWVGRQLLKTETGI